MKSTHKAAIAAVLVGGSLVGGALGATLIGSAGAQTTPSITTVVTTPAATDPGNSTGQQYNTDPAHEAGESAQRQADEASGKAGFEDGHSNTDPAHEAGESAQRQADEAAHDAQTGSSTTPTTGG